MSPEFVVSSREPSADRTLEVAVGEYVFQEGELGTEMFIIQEGQVEICQAVGSQDRPLAMLEKGDFFGEMSILEDLPRNASARAATPIPTHRHRRRHLRFDAPRESGDWSPHHAEAVAKSTNDRRVAPQGPGLRGGTHRSWQPSCGLR